MNIRQFIWGKNTREENTPRKTTAHMPLIFELVDDEEPNILIAESRQGDMVGAAYFTKLYGGMWVNIEVERPFIYSDVALQLVNRLVQLYPGLQLFGDFGDPVVLDIVLQHNQELSRGI